jgi:hypothetical protein
MSTFRNNTPNRLIIPTPKGAQRFLDPGDTFEGSNYYKRFTDLTVVTDDGSAWAVDEPSAGSVKRTRTLVVQNGSSWADNSIDFLTLLGAPAHYIQIEVSAGEVQYRFNGDTNPEAGSILSNNESQTFERDDFLAESIQFDASYSGASGGTVVVTAIGDPDQ